MIKMIYFTLLNEDNTFEHTVIKIFIFIKLVFILQMTIGRYVLV